MGTYILFILNILIGGRYMVLTEHESKLLLTLSSSSRPQMISQLIKKSLMSPSTLYRAVEGLLEKGLIAEDRSRGVRIIRLTDKGGRIAKLLEEIERALHE
jgi:DNA-binding MarR family transcriptional regulator